MTTLERGEPLPWLAAQMGTVGRFAALAAPWISAGANVLPILPGAKNPVVAGWGSTGQHAFALAGRWGLGRHPLHSEDSPKLPTDQYVEWARHFRDMNVAILPATFGATVIDVDDLSRLDDVLEICGDTRYRTYSGRDGGGVHLWYAGTTASRSKICCGVDVKSTGGYVLAPGSLHVSGREYQASPELIAGLTAGRLDLPAPRPGWRAELTRLDSDLRRPNRLDLAALADKLTNKPDQRTWGKALRAIAEGKRFAAPGEADAALFRTLSILSKHWPHADTDSIVALYRPSAELMEAESGQGACPFPEDVIQKWERLTAETEEAEIEEDERTRAARRLGWRWVKIESDAPADRTTGPLVVHKGRSYYLRIGDQFVGPWTREDLTPDVLRVLGALYGIEVGDVPALLAGFGERPAEVLPTLSERRTTYSGGVLRVAVAPIRPELTPVYSAAVDQVIGEIGGQYAHLLRHWLAGLLRTEMPSRALVLSGARGRGKTLLIDGVARLWPTGAAKMRDVLGRQFNAALTDSALAVADDDTSGSVDTGQALAAFLREGVSDRRQRLERKHHDVESVDGCMRYIIATNDPFELIQGAVSYKLNQASVEAFADRILHIPVPDSALGCWERAGVTGDDLVAGDMIARHVLWLTDAMRAAPPLDRFWSPEGDPELARLAVLSSGLRGDVLVHIAENIDERTPGLGGDAWVTADEHVVHVRPKNMLQHWIDKPRGATARTVGGALKALADASRAEQPTRRGPVIRAIDRALVEWYAERSGVR